MSLVPIEESNIVFDLFTPVPYNDLSIIALDTTSMNDRVVDTFLQSISVV